MPRADSSSRNPPVSLEVSLLGRPLALPDLLQQVTPAGFLQAGGEVRGAVATSAIANPPKGGAYIVSTSFFQGVLIGAVLGQGEAGQGHQHQRGLGEPPERPG